jgi:hypothetical protein
MAANSVPGQVAAGIIDGYLRDDAGDGTLGLPDYSPVPYKYSQLLGDATSSPQWYLSQFRSTGFAGFKGSPDGYGALRDTGNVRGAASIMVTPQTTGTITASPDGTRDPDYTWGPRDFAFTVRHPGTLWTPSGTPLAFVALTQSNNTLGMRLTIPASAQGPWDAEKADSAAITIPSAITVWDGNPHTFSLGTFGQNVFCIVDGRWCVPFRSPRAYKRNADGSTNTSVWADMPSTGTYVGADWRGSDTNLYEWDAHMQPSGDLFLYDRGATTVVTPPSTVYTPTTTGSGETWSLSGTVTASKNGILVSANATATFTVAWPYGLLCTRWGTAQAEGGLVLRMQDANNYYQVTSTGVYYCQAGTLTKFFSFSTPIAANSDVVVKNGPTFVLVYVNGALVANLTVSRFTTAAGIGFRSPSTGSSTWGYITWLPLVSDIVLPTS